MASRKWTVYKHTSPSGKVYIGITSTKPEYRWREGLGYSKQKYFFNAIIKYGWRNIVHEILYSNLTKEEAVLQEKTLISYYKNLGISYNITDGGEGTLGTTRVFTDEWRDKLSKAHIGLHPSESTKEKMSKSRKGKRQTSDWIEKRACSRRVKIVAEKDGFTKEYNSIEEAAKELQINQSNISAVCRKQRAKAGGYKFKYKRL
jgi:group I intron endonuclease